MERVLHIGIFDPQLGATRWLFSTSSGSIPHPAVYIMILPAMAVMSEVIPTFSHKTIFGYKAIAFSSVAIALLASWSGRITCLSAGMSTYARCDFFVPDLLYRQFHRPSKYSTGSPPCGSGSIERCVPPMLYAIAFLLLFTIRGLDRSFLASLATTSTYTTHTSSSRTCHFVMAGSNLFRAAGRIALLVAEDVWPPVQRDPREPRMCADFLGFNATFLPQFVLGSRGMPRRYSTTPAVSGVARRLHHRQLDLAADFSRSGHSARITAPAKGMVDNPWGGKTP